MLTQLEISEIVMALQGVIQRLHTHLAPTVQPPDLSVPVELVPFDPPHVLGCPSGFQIPTGTYRGRRLNELDNDTLRNLYNGFKGCRRHDIADTILAEIHSRREL